MKKTGLEALAQTLNQANVPFIIVGGIAVVHHGYGRATHDIDLVVRLDNDVILRLFKALAEIGYQPSVPITAEDFADANKRALWRREKNMEVLKFWSDQHRETPVDVFTHEPFDFEKEFTEADILKIRPDLAIRIIKLATLLEMKRSVARPQDIADVDELNLLHGKPSSYD